MVNISIYASLYSVGKTGCCKFLQFWVEIIFRLGAMYIESCLHIVTRMTVILQTIISNWFSFIKSVIFRLMFTEVSVEKPSWQQVSIGSDNGLFEKATRHNLNKWWPGLLTHMRLFDWMRRRHLGHSCRGRVYNTPPLRLYIAVASHELQGVSKHPPTIRILLTICSLQVKH